MPPAARSRFTHRALLIAALGLGLFLIIRGLHPLLAVLGALLPFLPRLINALKAITTLRFLARFVQGAMVGKQTSKIETRWLRVTLNRRSGEIEGEVLAGHYQGKLLAELTHEELLHVLTECQKQDKYSATILEAYLDRRGGGNWRSGYGNTKEQKTRPKTGKMTVTEAYEILGLPPGSGRKDVIAAYRRLIQKLHPDRGGSTLLATQINEAKNLLLGLLSKNG